MFRSVTVAALLILPLFPVIAQDTAASEPPLARIRSVTINAGEKCPESVNGEIVVCSTLEEPYRIPKALRTTRPTAANRTWASRVESLDEIGREGGSVPNSCSPTGTAGQTGCTQQLIDRWRAERRETQQDRRAPQ